MLSDKAADTLCGFSDLPPRSMSGAEKMRDQSVQFEGDDAGQGVDTAQDRRRSPRVPHRVVFNVRPLLNDGIGANVAVVLQDLSITGLGIIHGSAMRKGDQYQIPLTREGAEPLSLVATVVRCEQLDDGLYSIGFRFNSSAAAVDEGSRQLTGQPAPRE